VKPATVLADLPFVPAALQFVDLDNDEDQDILLGCTAGPKGGIESCILVNETASQGEMSFRAWPQSQEYREGLLPTLAADHNRDGKQDIWCFDGSFPGGLSILENTGAADRGLTVALPSQPALMGSAGVGSAVRFYAPGKGGDPGYLLGTRHISSASADGVDSPQEICFAECEHPFVDIELVPACAGPVCLLPLVPVGKAVTLSSSEAYPIKSAVGRADARRAFVSYKRRALTDVKDRFLEVAGAHARKPGMREFLHRLLVVNDLSEQLAHHMNKLTDISTKRLLGAGTPQRIIPERHTFGTIRYFLSAYAQECKGRSKTVARGGRGNFVALLDAMDGRSACGDGRGDLQARGLPALRPSLGDARADAGSPGPAGVSATGEGRSSGDRAVAGSVGGVVAAAVGAAS